MPSVGGTDLQDARASFQVLGVPPTNPDPLRIINLRDDTETRNTGE